MVGYRGSRCLLTDPWERLPCLGGSEKKRSLGRTARCRVRVGDRKVIIFLYNEGVAAARAACLRSRRRGDVSRLMSLLVVRARLSCCADETPNMASLTASWGEGAKTVLLVKMRAEKSL